jgi:hypothetical protein
VKPCSQDHRPVTDENALEPTLQMLPVVEPQGRARMLDPLARFDGTARDLSLL